MEKAIDWDLGELDSFTICKGSSACVTMPQLPIFKTKINLLVF